MQEASRGQRRRDDQAAVQSRTERLTALLPLQHVLHKHGESVHTTWRRWANERYVHTDGVYDVHLLMGLEVP